MIPKTHPRKFSLEIRHKLVRGFQEGLVAKAGLIAHGRGEAFDYLLGEKTVKEAGEAEKAAAAMLLLAEDPVISVNGNTTALCPKEIVKLAKIVDAKIEVNLFYRTLGRERRIKTALKKAGAKKVYGVGSKPKRVKGLSSKRGLIDDALWNSDVVLVPLEDGDRTEALRKAGKKVIAVDLNPMSRTSRKASITIVDNMVRAIPNMIEISKKLKKNPSKKLNEIVGEFNNRKNLKLMESLIRKTV